MGGRREVSIIFYRPVTRSDLKQERSFFCGSVSSFLQLVVAQCSKLAILLILRCSFQRCRRIFPNLSMSKVEKKHELVYLQQIFLVTVYTLTNFISYKIFCNAKVALPIPRTTKAALGISIFSRPATSSFQK